MEYNSSSLFTAENASLVFFFLLACVIIIPASFFMFIDWWNNENRGGKWNAEKQRWDTYSNYFQNQPKPPPIVVCRWKTYLDKNGDKYK